MGGSCDRKKRHGRCTYHRVKKTDMKKSTECEKSIRGYYHVDGVRDGKKEKKRKKEKEKAESSGQRNSYVHTARTLG